MNIVGLMKQMTPLFLHNKSKVIIGCKNKSKELPSRLQIVVPPPLFPPVLSRNVLFNSMISFATGEKSIS